MLVKIGSIVLALAGIGDCLLCSRERVERLRRAVERLLLKVEERAKQDGEARQTESSRTQDFSLLFYLSFR